MTLPKGKPTPAERGTRFRHPDTMQEGPSESAELANDDVVADEEVADLDDEPDVTEQVALARDRPTVTELPAAVEPESLERPSIIIRQRPTVTDVPDLPAEPVNSAAHTLRPVAQEWQPQPAARVERPTVMSISEVHPAPPRWGLWIGVGAGIVALLSAVVALLFVPAAGPVQQSPTAHQEAQRPGPPVPPSLIVEAKEPLVPAEPVPPPAPEPDAAAPEPPRVALPPEPPPQRTADKSPSWTHVVTGTSADPDAPWLALRDQPSSDAELRAKLPDGTKMRVLAGNGRWREVVVVGGADGGARGFVHARWIAPK
jgi:hypothetical protein